MRQLSLVNTLAATLVAATCLAAVEGQDAPAGELRLLLGTSPGYEVSEDAKNAGGDVTYEWGGTEANAGTVAMQYVVEVGQPTYFLGQPILGGELLVTGADLRPKTYNADGVVYANTDGEKLTYLAVTPTLVAGWRFAKPASSAIDVIGELQFLLGATVLTGEISNSLGSDRSYGLGFETGARLLLGIQEEGWTGAVVVGARRGWASLTFDQDAAGNSFSTTSNLDRIGAELMLVIGHSF
jgi:hypothetical protein